MTKWERRQRRESQQKYRKLGPSPATILENTQVVLCVQIAMVTNWLQCDWRDVGAGEKK